MSELRECPRCKESVSLQRFNTHPSLKARIICSCGIEMRASKRDSIEDLIERWNTRAERTCEPVKKFSEESPWPRLVCSECGRELHWDDIVNEVGEDSCELQPYCGCGARVVKP